MLKIIDKILLKFYSVFTYEATFNWFVIAVIGFMVRSDHISPEDGKRLVKRVIGIPGDTVAMLKNRLYINGQFLVYQEQD